MFMFIVYDYVRVCVLWRRRGGPRPCTPCGAQAASPRGRSTPHAREGQHGGIHCRRTPLAGAPLPTRKGVEQGAHPRAAAPLPREMRSREHSAIAVCVCVVCLRVCSVVLVLRVCVCV